MKAPKIIAGRLLGQPQQRGQRDLFRLALEYLKHGHAFDAFFVEHLLEDRRFEDAEPDPQPDPHHDDADEERDAPAPHQERSPDSQLKTSTARLARKNPAGAPNCGQEAMKPRLRSVRAHSIASNTEPPHSPAIGKSSVHRVNRQLVKKRPRTVSYYCDIVNLLTWS